MVFQGRYSLVDFGIPPQAISFSGVTHRLPCLQGYDWDVWVRWDSNRRDRECVIPDISRTFHSGIAGSHASNSFHALYYQDHAVNHVPDVQLKNVNR